MKKNIKSLEQEFIKAAIANHRLIAAGDTAGANIEHKKVVSTFKKISLHKDKPEEFLRDVLKNEHPGVRLWAATYLLPLDSETAVSNIIKVASSDAPWQIQAQADALLDLWRCGKLKLL